MLSRSQRSKVPIILITLLTLWVANPVCFNSREQDALTTAPNNN